LDSDEMGWFTTVRALLVRALFATHGIVTIAYLHRQTRKPQYWYLAASVAGLLLESIVTFGANRGREWKWFCPSAFFYLLITVPATWFLELELVEWRIECNNTYKTTDDMVCQAKRMGNVSVIKNTPHELDFLETQNFEQTIRRLEQLLLLLLILGRWMLPKGKLTHDQLSQLLL
uniref:DUF4220 domain-containing protein n=1 Tax=Macrostomum lignano TaxID=282301 RepID=A0A1I8HMP1_9PLAT